jgi:hypothetical protein
MNWRRWNNIIHRDLGYLCFGLTIIYVISGVAVNHIQDWNPTYQIEKVRTNIGPIISEGRMITDLEVRDVLKKIGAGSEFKKKFQPGPDTIKIYQEGNTIDVELLTGNVVQEQVAKRPFFFQVNFLHLNHPKKLWTWFADFYAVCLGILACTGILVLRGKKGITGRGAWLTAAGFILPLFFLWLYG